MKRNARRTFTLASLICQSRRAMLNAAYASFTAGIITTGGLTLGSPAPVIAQSENDCSSPARGTGLTFDFRDACARHDACYDDVRDIYGREKRKNFEPFIECDDQFYANMKSHCEGRWDSSDLRLGGCKAAAWRYYKAVLSITKYIGRS